MSIVVKPSTPRARGNQWYPLPHDYDTLTDEGMRQARVHACRQWMLQGPRSLKGDQFAECVRFFDTYYLMPATENGVVVHDPLFYKSLLPTPAFHYTILRSIMSERKTAFVGPRGSAKTIGVFTKSILLTMLAHPMYGITYATSTNELAEEMGDRCKYQFYNNQRINDDFGPEYGGQIKPKKSEGKMGMGAFKLSNRSSFFATSAQSVQRGLRPDIYMLDDPEYDAKRSASVDVLAEGTERLIFEIALPMVQQADTHLVWGGTFISLRHYLWRAMQTEMVLIDGIKQERPIEPKFGSWRRIIVDVEGTGAGNKRTSCWPEQWPADEEEKKRLGLQETTQTLADIEAELGPDRYMTEYRARPGQGKGAYFPPLTKDDHYFWPKDMSTDEQLFSSPTKSGAILRLMRKSGSSWNTVDMTIRDVLTRFPRFIVCDASDTATRASDYKTAMCLTITDANELLVLDLWAGQVDEDEQIDHVFKMADKWLVPSVHVEDIKAGKHLKEAMSYRVSTRAMDVLGIKHLPAIASFNPGMTDKQTKIKTMRWRFMHGKMKFPWHLRDEPAFAMLFHQIANFHPLAANGGLEKDDCLDTLSMMQYVVKGLSSHTGQAEQVEKSDVEKLLEGQTQTKGGMPLLATAFHKMSADDIDRALAAISANGGTDRARKHFGSVL